MLFKYLSKYNSDILHAFVYLSNCYILFFIIDIFNIKNFFDFDLFDNIKSRKQIIKHAKKRQIREKHQQQQMFKFRFQFIFFIFFFFFFEIRFHKNLFSLSINNLSMNTTSYNTFTI